MEVTLFRHGIAVDRADPRCPVDFERPLTLEGKQRAAIAIRGLKALGLKPDRVIVSPYVRCQQTARLVMQELGLARRSLVTSDELVPGIDPRAIWGTLAATPASAVLLVGHGGTLEPMAGVALGIPTLLPPEPEAPPNESVRDVAFRSLQLKKAGAMHLDVRFDPTLDARLLWHLPSRVLRLLARP
jgi:phosphohistidine phosphatase SixA